MTQDNRDVVVILLLRFGYLVIEASAYRPRGSAHAEQPEEPMTAVMAPAAALLGLSLTLGPAAPTVPSRPDPGWRYGSTAAASRLVWSASYHGDTTRAVTAAAAAAVRVARSQTVTTKRVTRVQSATAAGRGGAVSTKRAARTHKASASGRSRAVSTKRAARARKARASGAQGAAASTRSLRISCAGGSWPTAVKSRIASLFKVRQIGGYRAGGGDHSAGLAIDVMVGRNKAVGDRVARWSQANAKALNIKYVIWYQRIWFPGKSANSWRAMGDRGGATANHLDHVHISFNRGKGRCG